MHLSYSLAGRFSRTLVVSAAVGDTGDVEDTDGFQGRRKEVSSQFKLVYQAPPGPTTLVMMQVPRKHTTRVTSLKPLNGSRQFLPTNAAITVHVLDPECCFGGVAILYNVKIHVLL